MPNPTHPIQKAQLELTEATADLHRYNELVAAGDIANPACITTTSVFRRMKDAMHRMELIASSGAMDEVGHIATSLTVAA